MRKLFVLCVLFAATTPLFAVQGDDCSGFQQLAMLYEVRSLMLKPFTSSYDVDKFIDAQLEQLRGPQPDGSYRWVRWVRPGSNPPYDKHGHTVGAVNGSGSDSFEASGDHAFEVAVVVPQKKTLFSGNNPVYVGTVHVSYTIEGRTHTKDLPINAWMNPDTSRTIDLGAIADHAQASLDASANAKDARNALVELHFRKAVPRDDPDNPGFETIQALQRVRGTTDPEAIDSEIARAEHAVFPGSDPFPVATFFADLRHAQDLIHSKKEKDQKEGRDLLEDTLRKLH